MTPASLTAARTRSIALPPAYLLVVAGPLVFLFSSNMIVPLTGLFLVAVAGQAAIAGQSAQLLPSRALLPAVVAILGLLVLGWASVTWSIVPERSLDRALKLTPLALLTLVAVSPAAIAVLRAHARGLLIGAAIGCTVSAAIAAADLTLGFPLQELALAISEEDDRLRPSFYNRGLTFILLIGIAPLAWLLAERQWPAAGVLAVTVLAAAALGVSNAMKLAILAAAAIAVLAAWRPAWAGWGMVGGAGAFAVVQPFVWYGIADRVETFHWPARSAYTRIEIWDYTSLAVLQRPFTGWGLDVTRYLPTMVEREDSFSVVSKIYNHTHNNFLELWATLGLFGLVLGLVLIAEIVRHVLRIADRTVRVVAVTATAAGLVISFVAYGVYQDTWLTAVVVCIILFRLAATDRATKLDRAQA